MVQEFACSISYSINKTVNPHVLPRFKINPHPKSLWCGTNYTSRPKERNNPA